MTERDRLSGSFRWFITGRRMQNTPRLDLRPSVVECDVTKFCSVRIIAR